MTTTLRTTLLILTSLGCLRPCTWTSSLKKYLYSVYSAIITSLLLSALLSHTLDIVFNVQTQEDLSDNIIITVSVVGCICKMYTFLANRNNIMILIRALRRKPFMPVNEEEMNIKMRFDKIIEENAIQFMWLVQATMMLVWVSTPVMEAKNRKLPFRAWIPYNYSSATLYMVTYLYQYVTLTLDTMMHIGCDSLFSGLLICVYCQLEILKHRLQNIKNDQNRSANICAFHHHQIYIYASKLSRSFRIMLCYQLVATVSMVCFSIFQLTQARLNGKAVEHVMFMICVLIQLFYYCWYGNEVRRKSLEVPDMIFESNWMNLDNESKKVLLVIMLRGTFPMEFKSAHIMSVNLESFMAVCINYYPHFSLFYGQMLACRVR
ncbi:odorant receptor 49b-like isoform X1 [Megalopta genalis]|uniref:odorant receptor 49b-like isoform X1 n=1 Tax=Megalopta genalis TaxID=115081 RepID=UPI003FCFAC1C